MSLVVASLGAHLITSSPEACACYYPQPIPSPTPPYWVGDPYYGIRTGQCCTSQDSIHSYDSSGNLVYPPPGQINVSGRTATVGGGANECDIRGWAPKADGTMTSETVQSTTMDVYSNTGIDGCTFHAPAGGTCVGQWGTRFDYSYVGGYIRTAGGGYGCGGSYYATNPAYPVYAKCEEEVRTSPCNPESSWTAYDGLRVTGSECVTGSSKFATACRPLILLYSTPKLSYWKIETKGIKTPDGKDGVKIIAKIATECTDALTKYSRHPMIKIRLRKGSTNRIWGPFELEGGGNDWSIILPKSSFAVGSDGNWPGTTFQVTVYVRNVPSFKADF